MLTSIIHNQLIHNHDEQPARLYLGASGLGNPCSRAVWYDYNHVSREPYNAKTLLTFEIGKQLEVMLLELLEADPNIQVYSIPSRMTKAQCNELPELQGHVDAIIVKDGEHYVLEIKTANSASFATAVKSGVKCWRSQYFDQVQLYMGMMSIPRAVVLVINKDSSDLYEEVIEYDRLHYELLVEKAKMLVAMKEPPEKLNQSAMYFVCKMCNFRKVCHG